MMMTGTADTEEAVLAYAVLDASRPFRLPTICGLWDAQLRTREIAGLRVVYSRLVPQPTAPDVEQLQAFYEVIEQLHARYDVLPLRWGQHFPDPQALTRAIAADADLYLRRLTRLVGTTEMGIRFLPASAQSISEAILRPSPHSQGRAFLEQRRARYGMEAAGQMQRRRIEELCRNAFAGLFQDLKGETAQAQGADSQVMIRVYFLISRTLVERFRQAYADLRPPAGARMLLTGPWPPFNFAA
ncbi:GvpL/GvpF family gas vesicle protein [Candidatus Thiosymbion oneisti]|uniref:GvpL/GvpF family gas vesicle protein n=1 Tax=Candidatus Thiosymbion oneisti TaxID=589554 RepID=UPI000B7D5DCF|nr:GvpL/GvpF family gas vesicle protein [Candidatus Thiosymbion oneisti]